MNGDSKNDIGKLVSSTMDEQEIQIPIRETRDVQIPIGFERRQVPIDIGYKNQTGINIAYQRQVPISLNGRTIELLDMDQYGHNSSILRKPMVFSVLDAKQTNTDYEYGVIQIEDNYEFDNITGDVITTDSHWSTITLTPSVIANGSVANDFNLDESNIVVSGNILMLPNIVLTKTGTPCKDVYGLQCFSVDDSSVDWKIGSQSVSTVGTPVLTANIMAKNTDWYDFNTSGLTGHQLAGIKVKNLDASGDYAISVSVATVFPDGASSSTIANPGNTEWHECNISSSMDFRDILFYINVYKKNMSGGFDPFYTKRFGYNVKNRDDNDDVNWFRVRLSKYPFAVGTSGGLSGVFSPDTLGEVTWHHAMTPNDDLRNTMPQCQIVIKTVHNGSVTEHSMNILNTVVASSNSMDMITSASSHPSIIDWTYATYANAYISGSNITSYIKPVLIKSAGMDFYMITDSNSVVGFQEQSGRSLITNYYMMSRISNLLSIGILKRADNTCQIGIKRYDKYYTAKYDFPISITEFSINEIHMVNSSEASLDFVVNYGSYSTYYTFFRSDMIEGNKLIAGSRELYLFISNRIDTLINKDEVVSLYTKNHELPVLQCNIVSTDSNVYSKTTKSFSVPLAINGSDIKNTVFMAGTISGLKNSITEINGVGKFVSDNFVVYMPGCLNMNLYIGYGSGVVVPLFVDSNPKSLYRHICSIPSYSKELSSFTSAPLKMEDEYPEIYNNSTIGDRTFMLGKTRFVSVGGSVYESGSLVMCPNTSRLHIYENNAKLFVQSGFFFLANDKQTNVYTFTELGTEIVMVIEDKILCNPIKTSIGIIAAGSRGLWMIGGIGGQGSIKKIYSSLFTVEQASLKTNLDNSVIAILDGSDSWTYDPLTTIDQVPEQVISNDGFIMATGDKEFVMVCVNQFSHVSHQKIFTDLQSANIIDIGSTSELIIIDLVEDGTGINVFQKKVNSYGEAVFEHDDTFVLTGSQMLEYSGQPLMSDVNVIEVFAKGTGTIVVTNESDQSTLYTVSVNSVNDYKSYFIKIGKRLNMLQLSFTISYGVKIMQRMVGTIVSKEILNA